MGWYYTQINQVRYPATSANWMAWFIGDDEVQHSRISQDSCSSIWSLRFMQGFKTLYGGSRLETSNQSHYLFIDVRFVFHNQRVDSAFNNKWGNIKMDYNRSMLYNLKYGIAARARRPSVGPERRSEKLHWSRTSSICYHLPPWLVLSKENTRQLAWCSQTNIIKKHTIRNPNKLTQTWTNEMVQCQLEVLNTFNAHYSKRTIKVLFTFLSTSYR